MIILNIKVKIICHKFRDKEGIEALVINFTWGEIKYY